MLETFFVKAVIVLWKRYGRYIFVSAVHIWTKKSLDLNEFLFSKLVFFLQNCKTFLYFALIMFMYFRSQCIWEFRSRVGNLTILLVFSLWQIGALERRRRITIFLQIVSLPAIEWIGGHRVPNEHLQTVRDDIWWIQFKLSTKWKSFVDSCSQSLILLLHSSFSFMANP